MAVIAQGAINIDENAKLAENAYSNAVSDAYKHSDKNKINVQTQLKGLNNESEYSPFDPRANDPNAGNHEDGDMWTQYVIGDRQQHIATNMWIWANGGWQAKQWDQQALSVKSLSALSENVGTLTSGDIYGVGIHGTTIDGSTIIGGKIVVDIGSEDNAGDGGFNPLYWNDNGYDPNNNGSAGFHFNNGLMKLKAQRSNRNGTPNPWTWDFTFIGPNDIKIRNSRNPDTGANGLNHRLDLRSNYVEIVDGSYNAPSTGGTAGCGLYPDGTAVISNTLYTASIEVGSKNVNSGRLTVNSAIWCNYDVYSHGQKLTSDYSKKDHINSFDSKKALTEILGTDIYSYQYKGNNEQTNIGPVIDDINNINNAKYKTSNYMVSSEDGDNYVQLQNAIGLLIGSVHELSNQNERLLGKITQLEAKQNGNN